MRKYIQHCQPIIKTKLMKQSMERRSFKDRPLLRFVDTNNYDECLRVCDLNGTLTYAQIISRLTKVGK